MCLDTVQAALTEYIGGELTAVGVMAAQWMVSSRIGLPNVAPMSATPLVSTCRSKRLSLSQHLAAAEAVDVMDVHLSLELLGLDSTDGGHLIGRFADEELVSLNDFVAAVRAAGLTETSSSDGQVWPLASPRQNYFSLR